MESRRRILDVARRLFAARGVDAVSMHEVGRAAGVGQGTLYRRFEHKGALCSALLGEEVEKLHGEVMARMGRREAPLEQLGWFLERLAVFNEANAPLLGGIRDSAEGERRVEMYRNPFYAWLRATLAALLWRAVERGEAARGLDVECVADLLLAAFNVDLYLYQRQELGMERERIVRSLQALLLDGVGGRSGGGRR